MKKSLLALVMFVSSQALAIPDGKYACTVTPKGDEKNQVKISFEIKNGEVPCQIGDGEYECQQWFLYSPESQQNFWLDGLVDGGSSDDEKGNWLVSADSDGCNIGKLILYKDSGFTKGFITSEFRCGAGDKERSAGKVSCKMK